jgi:3-oxoacyl-[acyl-carrier-protein] synthase-3
MLKTTSVQKDQNISCSTENFSLEQKKNSWFFSLDVASGDFPFSVVASGIALFFQEHKAATALLFGHKNDEMIYHLIFSSEVRQRVFWRSCERVIPQSLNAHKALEWKDSTLYCMLQSLKNNETCVGVSSGNTGAYVLLSTLILGRHKPLKPVLLRLLPTILDKKFPEVVSMTAMADMGALLEIQENDALMLALMMSAYLRTLHKISCPRIGLLNIGKESEKGLPSIKKAHEKLTYFYKNWKKQGFLTYKGFVEPTDILSGNYDAVITDGFSGNIVAKTMELMLVVFKHLMFLAFSSSWISKAVGFLVRPILGRVMKYASSKQYGFAPLIGLKKLCFKTHGNSDAQMWYQLLKQAWQMTAQGENLDCFQRACEEAAQNMSALLQETQKEQDHDKKIELIETPLLTHASCVHKDTVQDAIIDLVGWGHSLPPFEVNNDVLSEFLDTNHEWIFQRTGISKRCLVTLDEPDQTTSFLAIKAARKALERSNLNPDEIDGVIVATATPDNLFPSVAVRVQAALKSSKTACAFDVQAACSGFIYALEVARNMLLSKKMRHILVVGADVMSRILDWNDRKTAILFGDGAGAVILKRIEENNIKVDKNSWILESYRGLQEQILWSDGKYCDMLYVNGGPGSSPLCGVMHMEGQSVYKHGVMAFRQLIKNILLHVEEKDIQAYVLHQANIRMLYHVADDISIPREKIIFYGKEHGNTSAASIPLALSCALEDGKLKKGDLIIVGAFGSGFVGGGGLWRL